MLRTRSLILIFGCLIVSQPIAAQSQTANRWKVTGSIRLRFEDWDFFRTHAGDSSYGYGASLLRVAAGRQFHSQDWLFELAQPSLIGLPSQAVAPAPQGQLGFGGVYFAANPDRAAGILLKQAFVRFKEIGRAHV